MATETTKVATLGPAGTYSHQASRQYFGEQASYSLEGTITDAFEALEHSRCQRCVLPIVNSTNGIVQETHDCLQRYPVREVDRLKLKIGHALLRSRDANGKEVSTIYSHEQGLGQCKRYLERNYPSARIEAVNSTAAAAQMAKKDQNSLAVCSLLCAELYDLEVVDTEIQDGEANETTFVVFEKATK